MFRQWSHRENYHTYAALRGSRFKGKMMLTPDIIAHERRSHFIGEEIVVKNVVLAKERKEPVNEKVRIIEICRNFCVVTNGIYNYSVKWVDFLTSEEDE